MPSFTIESTYRLPVFLHRTYEAPTLQDACQLAIADDDWQGQKDDHESAGPTYLTGIWPGTDTAYEVAPLPVPPGFAEGETLPDAGARDLPAAAPKMELVMPRCRHCGSGRISWDANACWDEETQAWVSSQPMTARPASVAVPTAITWSTGCRLRRRARSMRSPGT